MTAPGAGLTTRGAGHQVDADFRALPLAGPAQDGLEAARRLGASHADVRVQRMRQLDTGLRDGQVSSDSDSTSLGMSVRVLVDGVWGAASSTELGTEAAVRCAREAVELARVAAPLATSRVELAAEPVHAGMEWVSRYQVDPFDVPAAERVGLLAERSRRLLAAPGIDHVDADLRALKEQKYYCDSAGTSTLQQRVLVAAEVSALSVGPQGPESMRTTAPAAARGWELVTGTGHDWDAELAELPALLAEKAGAPSIEPGTYTLVIDPSNLFLTIHESVGHATELDRALGYEAAYAGTSFATPDQLGALRYGSQLMNVTGDRTVPHGAATVGYDDEGVATTSWDIVRAGTLVGYQLDRRMAAQLGLGASNGCAYADSAFNVPVQRMANVSLAARPGGPSTEEIIAGVPDGIYVVGDRSWSIDMQRYNFQFTGQRFFRIRGGRLAGQVKDVAYQGSTPQFWAGLVEVGGPQTYQLGGVPNCGKAQPGQSAWVSHGCPTTVFDGVRVLNTRTEAGR